MPGACPERSRRGGKRPGAGAPKGNLNALKHGGSSVQLDLLLEALLAIPEIRAALISYQRHHDRMERKAIRAARDIFQQLAWEIPSSRDNHHPLGGLLHDFRNGQTQKT